MEVTITKKLSETGGNIILIIPKDIVKALSLGKGDLIEATIKRKTK